MGVRVPPTAPEPPLEGVVFQEYHGIRAPPETQIGTLRMVLVMKLKYVDTLSGDRKRIRRRYPKAFAEVLGESVF